MPISEARHDDDVCFKLSELQQHHLYNELYAQYWRIRMLEPKLHVPAPVYREWFLVYDGICIALENVKKGYL